MVQVNYNADRDLYPNCTFILWHWYHYHRFMRVEFILPFEMSSLMSILHNDDHYFLWSLLMIVIFLFIPRYRNLRTASDLWGNLLSLCHDIFSMMWCRNSEFWQWSLPLSLCLQKSVVDHIGLSGRQCGELSAQDIWLDKAEICLDMGLYQPARQLLAEARLVAEVSGKWPNCVRASMSTRWLLSVQDVWRNCY